MCKTYQLCTLSFKIHSTWYVQSYGPEPISDSTSKGKRKGGSKKPQGPKRREPLATQFTCLFCNHEKAVQVKIDKKLGVGDLYCKICGQKFQTTVNYLSAAVDVYSDWLDACETVAQTAVDREEETITEADKQFSTYASERPRASARIPDEEDGYDEDD